MYNVVESLSIPSAEAYIKKKIKSQKASHLFAWEVWHAFRTCK